jgi:hypothetical protein
MLYYYIAYNYHIYLMYIIFSLLNIVIVASTSFNLKNQDSSVSIVTSLRTGWPGFDSKKGNFFVSASRPTLGPTEPPVYWIPGVLSLGGGG